MGLFGYEVRVRLSTPGQPDGDTTSEIMNAVDADVILAQPGYLEVCGALKADDVTEAGETMRGVLNRIVLALKGHGFYPIAEGWDISETTDQSEN